MKILIISSGTPVKGGVATYVDVIADKLRLLGHETSILNIVSGCASNFSLLGDSALSLLKKLAKLDFAFRLSLLVARVMLYFRTLKIISRGKYDIVHVQDINACNAVYRLCKKRHIRLVLSVHGHLFDGNTAIRNIKKGSRLAAYLFKQEIKAYRNCSHIMTVSNYSFNIINTYIESRKISIIRNFADTSVFYRVSLQKKAQLRKIMGISDDQLVIIYAGRLTPFKGIEYIIRGLSNLKNDINYRFIISGRGSEKTKLEKLAAAEKIDRHILFTGEIPRQQLKQLYQLSDIFIMASMTGGSIQEGSPMALLEAMACGLSIITTPSGGIGDMLEHLKSAVFIKEKDPESIHNAFKLLYNNAELREKLSRNTLEKVQKYYSIDSVINKIIDIYTGEKAKDEKQCIADKWAT